MASKGVRKAAAAAGNASEVEKCLMYSSKSASQDSCVLTSQSPSQIPSGLFNNNQWLTADLK